MKKIWQLSLIVFVCFFLIGISSVNLVSATITGGTITYDGNYVIHTFLTSGSFNVTSVNNITILVVAGGGAGGTALDYSGGGGAGGLIYNNSYILYPGNYSVIVGTSGLNSSFGILDSFKAKGGGVGGTNTGGCGGVAAGNGGSGGGGAYGGCAAGLGFVGQGNDGGTNNPASNQGGGGGGAGAVGGYGTGYIGGNGGVGLQYNINGSNIYYAGGGAGDGTSGDGAGGLGGGGSPGIAGTNGLGGGGGVNGAGGSGVVIIRYLPALIVNLNSPINNSITTNNLVTFNCSATSTGSTIQNISLLTNVSGTLEINETQDFTGIGGTTNYSIFTKNIPLGTWSWTCKAFDSGGNSETKDSINLIVAKISNNGETYNNQTYETSSETFIINVSANIPASLTAANLIYDGTSYAGTNLGSGIWSRTIDIPTITVAVNKTFYWNFTYDGNQISSVTHNQTVNPIKLNLCNATYPIPFINFTFADESTLLAMNASVDLATFDYWLGSGAVTKEYIFQNNTPNPRYSFCFAPADKSLTIDLSFKYSNDSYPQRTFSYDNKVLTNSTTTKILYLLGSTDGIYSTLQFLDAGTNSPISGVAVTAEREISGTWTLVAQGLTDTAGSITFWVNPDFEHRISATKTGYAPVQVTITPTQSSYTVFMGTSANVTIPGYRYKNIRYVTYPGSGRLEPNTIYTFGFNVTADGNLISCKIEIRNLSSSVVATSSTGCGAYGGNISVTYNVGTSSKLFGYYYVDIGSGLELFKANDAWFIEFQNVTSTGGLLGFFEALRDLPEWGDTHNRQEFSSVVFFFFMMILIIGIFTFFSGYELSSPGAALILVWAFIAFGSVSGMLSIEGLSPYTWWNQYGMFIMVSFIFFGFILNTMRREAQ